MIILISVSVLLLELSPVISQESTKESTKESLYLKPCIVLEGVCYRCLFSTINFSEYEEKCSDPYRDIAKFNSSNVLEQVTERCTGKYGTLRWVAARKLKDTSEFVWLADNSPIEKEFWAPLFPLDSNGDCVALDVKEMKLKNIYCRYTFPYICSYSTSRRTVTRIDSKRSLVLGIVVAMLTFCLICTSIVGTTLYYTAQRKAKKRKARKRYKRTNEKPAGNKTPKTPKTMQRKSQEQRQWETNLKVVRAQLIQANKEQKKNFNKVLLSKQGRKPHHHPSVSSTVVMTMMSQRSYKELCERRSNEKQVSNSFTIQMTNETDQEDHQLVPGSSIKEGPETTTQKSLLPSSRLNKFKVGDKSNVQMSNLATQRPKEKPSKSSNDKRLKRLDGRETAPRKSVEGWNLKVKDINADQESEEPGPVLNSQAESCILL